MKPREIIDKLKSAGWSQGCSAKHAIAAVSPDGTYIVPISNHPSKDVPIGTIKSIERLTGVKLL